MNTEIRSGRIDLISDDTTYGVWNPMTAAMSTADIVDVKFMVWLSGLGDVKVRPGVQFSSDGVNWTDAAAKIDMSAGTPYATAIGWTADDGSWKPIASLATQHLFVRFGLWAKNVTSTATEGGQAQLAVQAKPQVAQTITAGPMRVWSNGNANPGDRLFIPMTGWIPAEQCVTVRGTVEMAATSGNIGIQCVWQQCNEPSVPSDWSTPSVSNVFGLEATADGIAFGSDFAAPPGAAITKKLLRFGVWTRSTSTDVIDACQATIRIDVRG